MKQIYIFVQKKILKLQNPYTHNLWNLQWGSKSPSPRNFHVEKSGLQLMIESPTKNQFLNQSDVSLVSLRDILQCEHCPCWCPLIATEYSSDFLNIDAFEAWYHHHIIVTLLPAQLIEQQVHIRRYFFFVLQSQ